MVGKVGSQVTTRTLGYDGKIDAMGTTGFYFDHDANKFRINITSIKIDNGKRRRDLTHFTNYPLEKYWLIDIALLSDSLPFHNPLHTVALHLTTTVIHLVDYNIHFEINVSMAHRAYASYAIFLATHF